MSALFACVNWDGRPVERDVLAAAAACVRHRCPDGAWSWADGAVGLAQADLATLPEDEPGAPVVMGRLRIAASCRVDNRAELRAALPPWSRPVNKTDAAHILAAYNAWGDACVDRLVGDFAFVIWDGERRRLFAARDLSGVRRLFYYQDRGRLALASEHTQLFQDPTLPMTVDDEEIVTFLTPAFQMNSGWDLGLFRGVRALPAGYSLTAEAGRVATRRFWQWQDRPPATWPEAEALEAYLHTLSEAVRCRLRSRAPQVALELSGGLDSSAVVALAAQLCGREGGELHSFSLVFERFAPPDELRRIMSVVDRYGLSSHRLIADELYTPLYLSGDWAPYGVVGPREITTVDRATLELYDMAVRAGSRILLTGMMGDSVNGGSELLHYLYLRQGRLGALADHIRLDWRRTSPRTAIGALLYHGLLPFAPRPLLQAGECMLALRPALSWELPAYISRETGARIGAGDRALRLDSVDRHAVRCPAVRSALEMVARPMVGTTFDYPQPLEQRHPYLDRRLIELTLAMPQELKWEHRHVRRADAMRRHHRLAMAGVLPAAALDQRVGMTFSAAASHGRDPAALLAWLDRRPEPLVVERGYVVAEPFRRAVARPADNREFLYTGAMLGLEAWLRALEPAGAMARLVPPRSLPRAPELTPAGRRPVEQRPAPA